jgi:hypothetical protein
MKYAILVVLLLAWSITAVADDSKFSTHLHAKFQSTACTNCHDFFVKKLGGLSFKSHKGRTSDICVFCHSQSVTGFKHPDEWFAMPGLYTSGMGPKQTCEAIKKALHAEFKNDKLMARQIENHVFEDPRVLWAIEKATPNSGKLPGDQKAKGLVTGGFDKWKTQVRAWIAGGMKCD